MPHILEVSPRFHGEINTTKVIPWGMFIEPVKEYFRYMTTGEWGGKLALKDYVRHPMGTGCCSIFAKESGRIKNIDVSQIENNYDFAILDIQTARQLGDWVNSPPQSTHDIVCYVYYDHEEPMSEKVFHSIHTHYNDLCQIGVTDGTQR